MKVAFVASEAIPHAKTGGLADVAGTLPVYLKKIGIDTSIFLPKYRGMKGSFLCNVEIEMRERLKIRIYTDGIYYFIDYPEFFDRQGLYGSEKGDYPDNCERFTLFCKAVSEFIENNGYDLVHCHDWQTGLIPVYVKLKGINAKTVFTIHNLGYQGQFSISNSAVLDIPQDYFGSEGMEHHGKINFLKTGILHSDVITTVSENYAKEIQTPDLGFGLDAVLRKRSRSLIGIINGIDYNLWNPRTDDFIYQKYDNYENKQKNKICLSNECNIELQRPLIGMISRIADQKGFDLLMKAFDSIVHMGFNLVLLGVGDEHYYGKLRTYERVYPHRVSINIKFDNKLAHRIYAGSDFFLMPSKYEPCGLGQLISLKYGTVPVVRKTGGLADSIAEFDRDAMSGNGFLFAEYAAEDLLRALAESYEVYSNKDIFKILSEKCMSYDFSWDASAEKYRSLYESLSSLKPRNLSSR